MRSKDKSMTAIK